MPKYRVYLIAVAEHAVEIEAEDGNRAVELAFENDLPRASFQNGFDLSDWSTSSEVFGTPQADDYEEIA